MKRLVFVIAIFATVLAVSCSKKDNGTQHTVTYHVSSAGAMNVSYTGSDWVLKTVNDVSSSWTYSFTTSEKGKEVKLTINSVIGGVVSGSIDIDGQQAVQNNSGSGSVTMTAQIP